ncbi:MAG: BMP family ABC transporter substrate-binding protein [Anaerolineales bacterium]|nr:BMP family ABC transporter substrate-binding protein [Anaerolineales bacterium]
MRKLFPRLAALALALMLVLSACGQAPAATEAPAAAPAATEAAPSEPFVFGVILIGARNDKGYSQAHYEAGLYVEQKIPGAKMLYLENVFSGSPSYPGQTTSQLASQLVDQGAKLIVFNSDDMKDEALKFAKENPNIYVIGASDDWTWKDGKTYTPSPNQIDIMGRMEYGKMMAGCAAALTSKTGKIGYLGPLINDETRRLAASAYLGAKHCWTEMLGKDASELQFKVTWIGFWFNIPGVTADPTQVADDFYNSGYDVVISGIDTTENIVEAKKMHDAGKEVWALPYDFKDNCNVAPDVCLGVPYFNWGPAYLATMKTAIDGTWQEGFQWNGPDWADINNPDTSAVGFVKGDALSAENSAKIDEFIAKLAGGLDLWTGPINLQDGTNYIADGKAATDAEVWYLPQLLEGMEGQSVPSN